MQINVNLCLMYAVSRYNILYIYMRNYLAKISNALFVLYNAMSNRKVDVASNFSDYHSVGTAI